jgi:hypothetical protein
MSQVLLTSSRDPIILITLLKFLQDSIGRVDTEVAKKYNFALANMIYGLNQRLMPGLLADIKAPAIFLLSNLLIYPEVAASPVIVREVKNTSNDGIKPRISDQLLFYSFFYLVDSIRLEQPIFLCSALSRLFNILGSDNKRLTVSEATSVWYSHNN